jgi:hypothetical protein
VIFARVGFVAQKRKFTRQMPATRPGEGGRGNGGDLHIINAHFANNPIDAKYVGLLAALLALGTMFEKTQAVPGERLPFHVSVWSPKNTALSCG